ncbi:MAG: 16S rRNA (cytosine(1402)-N(4))-methyltransferase RsmH [Nitrospinaceae bacterium]|jgi:16S rRNA (cytosine1402-N4)-methyltransferase|nr:16S rRNA (cytosine(1402)-N(4))-methyltransferase RsmH [Nitrospinaceae bacterium]|tara:strand:+ start:413 stop:1351 length:939 start_codon:yes stop_codon:yes gene_type:complete
MQKHHESVLAKEILQYLHPREDGLIVDGTLGNGGHTELILKNTAPGLRVLGIDRDEQAIERAGKRLAPFRNRVTLIHGNFSDIKNILKKANVMNVDGLLLDLGVSSPQLDSPERGFSFMRNGPLDMRMDSTQKTTAADLLVKLSDEELVLVIKEYGEERFAKRIVRAIRKAQEQNPITTTLQLSNIVSGVTHTPRPAKIHPATRTFQALRIAVNNELEHIKSALSDSLKVLSASARIMVISFHSLEDRIVKNFFKDEEKGCVCPPRLPVCACGHKTRLKIITRRPVTPASEEVKRNPRASSSKLRVAERVYV